jgi:23S rRNA (guanosine2251-2'-O)-methyltransferase
VPAFVTRQCTRDDCRLRFPVAADSRLGDRCPHCGSDTAVDVAYDSHDARASGAEATAGAPLEVLLDNVRSLRNVGSMFRTADGAGVSHMHLAGFTPTPAHPQMAKTALGAEAAVAWTLHRDGAAAAARLASEGKRLWALEGGPRSRAFDADTVAAAQAGPSVVLVLGHEVSGVDPRILERCERVLRLPMLGTKGSLNVSVAFGVAVYWLRFGGALVGPPKR